MEDILFEEGAGLRLGLFGGTFNPIHNGHLIMAQDAYERFELDRLIFIPCRIPPHKSSAALVEPRHRLAMIEHAIECDERFEVSDLELSREGLSYTIDTLTSFRGWYPNADIHFLIGADSLCELHDWKDADLLLERCQFITACRPGYDVSRDALGVSEKHRDLLLESLFNGHLIDISSTEIRMRVAEGMSIRYLVPCEVAMYICEHSLYLV